MRLIFAGEGNNDLVDKARGKLAVPIVMEPPTPVNGQPVRAQPDTDAAEWSEDVDLQRGMEEVTDGEEEFDDEAAVDD